MVLFIHSRCVPDNIACPLRYALRSWLCCICPPSQLVSLSEEELYLFETIAVLHAGGMRSASKAIDDSFAGINTGIYISTISRATAVPIPTMNVLGNRSTRQDVVHDLPRLLSVSGVVMLRTQVEFRDTRKTPDVSAVQVDEDSSYMAEDTSFVGFQGEVGVFEGILYTPIDRAIIHSLSPTALHLVRMG